MGGLFPSDLFGAIRAPNSQWLSTNGDDGVGKPTVRRTQRGIYFGLPLLVIVWFRSRCFSANEERTFFSGESGADRLRPVPGFPSHRIDGHNTSIPLPFPGVGRTTPLSGDLFPGSRFALYTALFAAAMLRHRAGAALATDEAIGSSPPGCPQDRRTVASVGALAALAAAAVLPLAPRHTQPTSQTNVAVFLHVGGRKGHSIQGAWSLPIPTRTTQVGRVLLRALRHHARPGRYRHALQADRRSCQGSCPSSRGNPRAPLRPSVLKPESVQAILDAHVPRRRHGRMMAPLSKSNVTALRVFLA